MDRPGLTHVIPAERIDLRSKRATDENVEKALDTRMVVDVHARNHEIVPGLLQRKEFQAEQLRRRANAEPHIGMSLGNRSCHLKMGAGIPAAMSF